MEKYALVIRRTTNTINELTGGPLVLANGQWGYAVADDTLVLRDLSGAFHNIIGEDAIQDYIRQNSYCKDPVSTVGALPSTDVNGSLRLVISENIYYYKAGGIWAPLGSTAAIITDDTLEGIGTVSDPLKLSQDTLDSIDDKVVKNTAIVGAQNTKITYDSKGLVTAGTTLSATDIPTLTVSKLSDYTTATDTRIDTKIATHVALNDPHSQYRQESKFDHIFSAVYINDVNYRHYKFGTINPDSNYGTYEITFTKSFYGTQHFADVTIALSVTNPSGTPVVDASYSGRLKNVGIYYKIVGATVELWCNFTGSGSGVSNGFGISTSSNYSNLLTIITSGTMAVDPTGLTVISQVSATPDLHAATHAVGGSDELTKSAIGLGNVDNTSDVNKPVSTATQSALNLKANLTTNTFTDQQLINKNDSGIYTSTNTAATPIGSEAFIVSNNQATTGTAVYTRLTTKNSSNLNLMAFDGLVSGSSFGNEYRFWGFRTASSAYTEAMRLSPNGQLTIGNATSNSHALNRITADGRYTQLSGSNSFTGQNRFSNANFSPLTAERTSTLTNTTRAGFQVTHKTTADAVDGFGAALAFSMIDSANVETPQGTIECVRNGADNTGKFNFVPYSVGGGVIAASIAHNGATFNVDVSVGTNRLNFDDVIMRQHISDSGIFAIYPITATIPALLIKRDAQSVALSGTADVALTTNNGTTITNHLVVQGTGVTLSSATSEANAVKLGGTTLPAFWGEANKFWIRPNRSASGRLEIYGASGEIALVARQPSTTTPVTFMFEGDTVQFRAGGAANVRFKIEATKVTSTVPTVMTAVNANGSPSLALESAYPSLGFNNTSAPSNSRRVRFTQDVNGSFYIAARNDGDTSGLGDWLRFSRNATTGIPDNITSYVELSASNFNVGDGFFKLSNPSLTHSIGSTAEKITFIANANTGYGKPSWAFGTPFIDVVTINSDPITSGLPGLKVSYGDTIVGVLKTGNITTASSSVQSMTNYNITPAVLSLPVFSNAPTTGLRAGYIYLNSTVGTVYYRNAANTAWVALL